MSPNTFDTSSESFASDVLEASKKVPVLVDFWAPWCAPCRGLKPVLEKLANEYDGKFLLAKLNTDENQEIATQYGIRGIPNVKAFVDGKVFDEFTGALPESAVRAFLDRVVPSPAAKLRKQAHELIASGDFDGAEGRLQDALALDAAAVPVRLDLAHLMIARQAFESAEQVLQPVAERDRDERYEKMSTQIDAWRKARELPSVEELAARLEREPDDPNLRMALAERLIAEMHFEPALEELLGVIRGTRGPQRDEARRLMVRVFALASDQADMVGHYRRLLAAELN